MTGDDRPIGVFDSGVGGLTVLRALKSALPDEATVYLGDTARVPYGTRSASTVVKYAINNARTLVAQGDIKLLVVACNTASAVSMPALAAELAPRGIPVVGVIEPGARAAVEATKGGTVAVLGTAGTVRSGAYPRALAALGHARSVAIACPLLVPLVEEGCLEGEIPRLVVDKYLRELPADVDTVVMGCTHYPLLRPVLRAALASHIALVDGAEATAREVKELLAREGLARPAPAGPPGAGEGPRHRLLVTDAPEQLAKLSPAFLGAAVPAERVETVDVVMTA